MTDSNKHGRLRARNYQRGPIRVINALLGAGQPLGIGRFRLDADELLASARRDTGLTDFGDERFLRQFRLLVRCTEEEARLNPVGKFLAKSNIERLLKGRLQAQALFAAHPEILAREIADPVVVVGLARSGTTRLHRLLAADDRFAHLKSWESVFPVPGEDSFRARETGEPDPRIKSLDQALKGVLYMSPQVAAVHPLGTLEVEEEIGLLQYAFATQLFEVINWMPTFAEYLMTHEQHFAYEYLADMLKLVAWFRGDPEDKPWILKSPQHMQDTDALLHVFPRAKLVCPHRDPVKVVGSSCSMAWNSLVRDNIGIEPEQVGAEWLTKTGRMLRKNLADRERAPAANQYDVLYAEITADWEGAMQGIYDFLGMPFTDRARGAMRGWLEENRQHKHGAHKYSLDQFGLDAAEVEAQLGFYRERFDIPRETRNPHLTQNQAP
jgi:hypothetical protein